MSSKTQTCWFHYMSTSHRHNGIYCTKVLSTNPHKPVDIRRFNAKHDLANLGTSHIVRNTSNALTTTCFIVFMKTFSKIWNTNTPNGSQSMSILFIHSMSKIWEILGQKSVICKLQLDKKCYNHPGLHFSKA